MKTIKKYRIEWDISTTQYNRIIEEGWFCDFVSSPLNGYDGKTHIMHRFHKHIPNIDEAEIREEFIKQCEQCKNDKL